MKNQDLNFKRQSALHDERFSWGSALRLPHECKRRFILCAALLGMLCWTGAAWADPASDLLAVMANTHHYQARFVQQLVDDDQQILQESSGRVEAAKPHRFRWDVQVPNQQLILADGHYLWFYDAALAQVIKRPLSGTPGDASMGPGQWLDLLWGTPAQLSRVYKVSRVGAVADEIFMLQPRQAESAIHSIRLQFRAGQLIAVDITNALGQHNRIRFKEIQENTPIARNRFNYTPPADVDVVYQSA